MIPWDDDIDMMMPRADYERFCTLWPEQMKGTPYVLCRDDDEHYYRSLLTAIVDTRTTFIKERQVDLDIPHGIRVKCSRWMLCPKENGTGACRFSMRFCFKCTPCGKPPLAVAVFSM